jgi:hypothetical protein
MVTAFSKMNLPLIYLEAEEGELNLNRLYETGFCQYSVGALLRVFLDWERHSLDFSMDLHIVVLELYHQD